MTKTNPVTFIGGPWDGMTVLVSDEAFEDARDWDLVRSSPDSRVLDTYRVGESPHQRVSVSRG